MKILVVDDDPTCRTIVAMRLKGLGGIEVTEAEDGDKAWALLKRNHYDGAIVDWQMPGKSGLEIVREIRKAGITIPLLMVTGRVGERAGRRGHPGRHHRLPDQAFRHRSAAGEARQVRRIDRPADARRRRAGVKPARFDNFPPALQSTHGG